VWDLGQEGSDFTEERAWVRAEEGEERWREQADMLLRISAEGRPGGTEGRTEVKAFKASSYFPSRYKLIASCFVVMLCSGGAGGLAVDEAVLGFVGGVQ